MAQTVRQTDWGQSWRELTAIREQVFIREQAVPVELEVDAEDDYCDHWLAYAGEQPVGTVRLTPGGKIGRMAVLKSHRGHGLGRLLLNTVIAAARAKNMREVSLSAQQYLIPFYQSVGFIAEGPIYMDAGIPHQDMRLLLREEHRLGVDSLKFRVEDPAAIALELASQCQRQLRVLSTSLEPDIFAGDGFVQALSELARKHRDSQIRLLISDDRPLRETRHPLVVLSQRLSAIEIRLMPGKQPLEKSECYILSDKQGLMVYKARNETQAWASFNLKPVVHEYQERFDRCWYHSRPSPWLRKFY